MTRRSHLRSKEYPDASGQEIGRFLPPSRPSPARRCRLDGRRKKAVGQPSAALVSAPAAGVTAPKLISPSRIARYFFHECPRYLRYSSTPKEQLAEEGVPEPPFDHSPVTTAILEGGYTWEEEVVTNRLKGRAFIAEGKPGTRLKDRVWGAAETRRILSKLEPGQSIYQPTLITPPSFYARYGIDPAVVQMTDCRPDLIVCEESATGPVLRVVDIKASPGLKLSHRIQATLYTLILRHVLEDWGEERLRVDDAAAIWLAQADEPQPLDTRSIRPPLENFLEREVQPLLERPADQAPWHVYYRCEWCPYFDHCRAEMAGTDDISRLPYLSTYAKQFLGTLDPPVQTLADFERLLDDPQRVGLLDDCASLAGEPTASASRSRAMRKGDAQVHDGATLAMPRGENIRLVITVQTEPVSGQVYAYGIQAQGLREVLGENPKPMVNVARRVPHPECSAELEREFVRALYGLLKPVHDHNSHRRMEVPEDPASLHLRHLRARPAHRRPAPPRGRSRGRRGGPPGLLPLPAPRADPDQESARRRGRLPGRRPGGGRSATAWPCPSTSPTASRTPPGC